MNDQSPQVRKLDPITFEVVRGGLISICEEMRTVMCRAAFSPLLSLSADLSTAILDIEGSVVAQGNDIPVHLGAMPFTGRAILGLLPPSTWQPGDAVLTNDPYCGGNHLPDMTLVSPVFHHNRLVAFTANRVHWPDIGGASAGSSGVTDDIIKEGLRIPPIKIARNGVFEPDILKIIFSNVRVPLDRMGDLNAQYACNARGVARVQELVHRYGADTVTKIMQEMRLYSRLQVEDVISGLRHGRYTAEDHLDGDGYVLDDGTGPFHIKVSIELTAKGMVCDFTGTCGAARGPINAPFAVTASVCYYVLLALCDGAVTPNSGAYDTVEIIAPPGCLLHALPPAPVVSANTETSNRLVDLLLRALAPAMPERVIGESYGSAGIFTLGGFDTIRDRRFVHYESLGGGMGASKSGDGADGIRVHMGNTMNLPVEAVEAALPILVEEYALISGSGGEGTNIGGMGTRKRIRALTGDIEFSVGGERSLHPAQGVNGGKEGSPSASTVLRQDGSMERLASKIQAGKLSCGEQLTIATAGGGGWGSAGTNKKGESHS
ncbi:MAG: hydantoinase B/oxoprolinase family protein [Pseudolabrys sp.]|nr:hydantoinase B/oxoprolinase family protein [Pseudolabrys sp.]